MRRSDSFFFDSWTNIRKTCHLISSSMNSISIRLFGFMLTKVENPCSRQYDVDLKFENYRLVFEEFFFFHPILTCIFSTRIQNPFNGTRL